MRTVRRSRWEARVEMTPLIDVVFLLLTFFLYSLVIMIRAEILPMRLTSLSAADQPDPQTLTQDQLYAISIDAEGGLYLNRQAVSLEELEIRLKESLVRGPDQPGTRVFVAMEADGRVDRGPLLLKVIERLHTLGIENVVLVGQKP